MDQRQLRGEQVEGAGAEEQARGDHAPLPDPRGGHPLDRDRRAARDDQAGPARRASARSAARTARARSAPPVSAPSTSMAIGHVGRRAIPGRPRRTPRPRKEGGQSSGDRRVDRGDRPARGLARVPVPVVPEPHPRPAGRPSGSAIEGVSRPSSSSLAHLSRELPRSATMRSTAHSPPDGERAPVRGASASSRPAPSVRSSRSLDRVEQGGDALAGDGRDRQRPRGRARRRSGRWRLGGAGQVHLGHDQQLGPLGQGGAVLLELAADRPVVRDRVGAVGGDGLDQVDEQAGPLDVAEELVAQAVALVGPFDQPGDVGDDERVSESMTTVPRLGYLVVNG